MPEFEQEVLNFVLPVEEKKKPEKPMANKKEIDNIKKRKRAEMEEEEKKDKAEDENEEEDKTEELPPAS